MRLGRSLAAGLILTGFVFLVDYIAKLLGKHF
jgi:hypothetical protein